MNLTGDGTWFWNGTLGAGSYENELYKLGIGEWGNYLLTFKAVPKNLMVVFAQGAGWRVVDMKMIGVEQR